jgi:glutathione S-transferase
MLKLYFGPGACSFVPLAALEIIKAATGEDFESQMVKLHKGEQFTPEFKAVNADSLVPVLMVDGQPLTQVIAICEYLDGRYPQLEMLPKDPWARARAISTLAWMNNSVHPTFTHVFMPFKYTADETAQAALKKHNLDLYRGLIERLNGEVAKASPYLNGAKIGFIDIYAVVFLRWAGLAGIDPDSYPAYKAYVDRIAALPAITAALEREKQPLHYFKKAA